MKDIKGKRELNSYSKFHNKESSANPISQKKNQKPIPSNKPTNALKFKQDKTKIKVYTIKRKDQTTLVRRTYLVDISTAIPFSVKNSQGPSDFGFLNLLEFAGNQ